MGSITGSIGVSVVYDAQQFAEMLDQHQQPLYTFLYGMLGNAEEARDLVQDTVIQAWHMVQRQAAPFDQPRPAVEIRRWLMRVAYFAALSTLRHKRVIRWQSLDADLLTSENSTTARFEDTIADQQVLAEVLAQLTPKDAACLLLIVVQGYSVSDVAAILHASPAAIAKRFTRAKQRLRAVYLKQQDDFQRGSHHV